MDLPVQELMYYCEEKELTGKLQQFIDDIRSFTEKETKELSSTELPNFLYAMNSDEFDRKSRNVYLQEMLGYGEIGNEVGVDFTLAWYRRNLIMMNNILRCVENERDRIFVLVGGSHRAMIKEYLMDREDVEYVEIAKYLRPKIHR